ncbi:hypothetical protein [Streptomyces sp. NPDC101455]|uniref:hypothetical protein n=1 Tax=Streptomyces sp. NPDC101455 TaxID=3366142 RepID=UPI003806710A
MTIRLSLRDLMRYLMRTVAPQVDAAEGATGQAPTAVPAAGLMRPDAPRSLTLRTRSVLRLWKLADRLRSVADSVDNMAATVHELGRREGRWSR